MTEIIQFPSGRIVREVEDYEELAPIEQPKVSWWWFVLGMAFAL